MLYWKTKSQILIKLSKLTDDHLINIIELLNRRGLADEYPDIYAEFNNRKLKLKSLSNCRW